MNVWRDHKKEKKSLSSSVLPKLFYQKTFEEFMIRSIWSLVLVFFLLLRVQAVFIFLAARKDFWFMILVIPYSFEHWCIFYQSTFSSTFSGPLYYQNNPSILFKIVALLNTAGFGKFGSNYIYPMLACWIVNQHPSSFSEFYQLPSHK